MASIPIGQLPATPPAESVEERFQRLAAVWRAETEYLSSSTEMFTHRAYQEIIGMGQPAVPLLLRDLQKEPDHWIWALMVITGANPVPASDSGNLDKMAETWLRWGREHGYQW